MYEIKAGQNLKNRLNNQMRQQGTISTWKDESGFGFIIPDEGGKQVFVHVSSFSNKRFRPAVNDRVTFDLHLDAKGRPNAQNVIYLNPGSKSTAPSPALDAEFETGQSKHAVFFVTAFFSILAYMIVVGELSIAVLGFYLVLSVITFFLYEQDKSAARKRQWRTQESTLHLFSLLGGWPGALVAQKLFRHKHKKQAFQVIFWFTVLMNWVLIAGSIYFQIELPLGRILGLKWMW